MRYLEKDMHGIKFTKKISCCAVCDNSVFEYNSDELAKVRCELSNRFIGDVTKIPSNCLLKKVEETEQSQEQEVNLYDLSPEQKGAINRIRSLLGMRPVSL